MQKSVPPRRILNVFIWSILALAVQLQQFTVKAFVLAPPKAFSTSTATSGSSSSSSTSASLPRKILFFPKLNAQTTEDSIPSNNKKDAKKRQWQSHVSTHPEPLRAWSKIFEEISGPNKEELDLAFLFVGQAHASQFPSLVEQAYLHLQGLNKDMRLISILGGGVIGEQVELDQMDRPSMSLLIGGLPAGAELKIIQYSNTEENNNNNDDDPYRKSLQLEDHYSSCLVFCDPWAPVENLLAEYLQSPGRVLAGGISCPSLADQSSLALNQHCLPQGSMIGIGLAGTLGLQTMVAQGCRPVGGTMYKITDCDGNVIKTLDGKPALEILERLANTAPPEEQKQISTGLLCGIASRSNGTSKKGDDAEAEEASIDFLSRQIIGFVPSVKGIAVGTSLIQKGDLFCFQVRDGTTAQHDLQLMVQRAKVSRLFDNAAAALGGNQGSKKSRPVAALQISCVARGRGMYDGVPNVDLSLVKELVEPSGSQETKQQQSSSSSNSNAVGGFFANGEIGPVGLAGFSTTKNTDGKSYLHSFTTVAAILCEYTDDNSVTNSPSFDNAFTNLFIVKGLKSGRSSPPSLKAIKGAAKDAEEDLRLTIQIIMEHQAKTSGASKEQAAEKEEEIEATVEEDEEVVTTEEEEETAAEEPTGKEEAQQEDVVEKTFMTKTTESTTAELPDIEINRDFRFVDAAEKDFKISDGRPTISCDGRIDIAGGITLELTHWTGNETPDELYADTSTEMALKLATNHEYSEKLKNAWVLNNHYDTDGVLSVWACLKPEEALIYKDLLIQGAEAGDFAEWSSDEGVKLDLALTAYLGRSYGEGTAFVLALQNLFPDILQDLQSTGGEKYADYWKKPFNTVLASWNDLQQEKAKITVFNDDIVIVERPWLVPPVSPYAMSRALKERGIDGTTKRILHVLTDVKGGRFKYEKVGHGWVQKLVQREAVPGVDDNKLVESLNAEYEGSNWKTGGDGLVAICQSAESIPVPVKEVAEYLSKHDDGLSR